MKGISFQLSQGRFTLDVRKKCFSGRVVRPWHRLPKEAVGAPALEVFKARLDRAWRNLVYCRVFLPMTGGVEQNEL